MKKELTIEFGSSNLRIYEKNVGLVFCEPNVAVYRTINSLETPVLFCKEAKEQEGKLPDNERLYCPIFMGILQDVDAQAEILQFALESIYSKVNYSQLKIILCVSCGCLPEDIENFKLVPNLIGIKEYYVAFQPQCISQLVFSNNQPQLIVDYGGGKTEVAIVLGNEILKGVKLDLGGEIMNAGVKEILKVEKNLLTSSSIIEKLKISIGSLFETDNAVTKIWAQNRATLNSNTYAIVAKDINLAFIDCHDKILMLIQAMLAECTPEIVSSISQNGIIFVGDGAKLLGIKKYYENKLKMKVRIFESYGNSVVEGASKFFKQFHSKKEYLM